MNDEIFDAEFFENAIEVENDWYMLVSEAEPIGEGVKDYGAPSPTIH